MHLIFFDEVKAQPDYPYYHIGGICVDESDLLDVEMEISKIAEHVFGHSRLNSETEFHAADIYHRKKAFKDMPDPLQRIEIIRKFIKIISNREKVGLIDIQVNVNRLHTNQNPEDIAFMFLCERANGLMKNRKSLGMLIGDREGDRVSERCSVSLSEYRAKGTDFAYGCEIKNLFESVHFTPSHLSRFLQLADMYVWILQFLKRHRSSTDTRHQSMIGVFREDGVNLFPSTYKEWPKET